MNLQNDDGNRLFPLPRKFVQEALRDYVDNIIRFHIIVCALDHGCKSLGDIARQFYDGPRHFKAAYPAYVEDNLAEYVDMVEGKLNKTQLHHANREIDDLFAKYFGTGRLIGGEGEGMAFDLVTEDGRRVAEVIEFLLDHWIQNVSVSK